MATNGTKSHLGKVTFVSGAASGIGRAAALAFAGEGASVVVADLSEQGNRETARMIEELGGRALALKCDVARVEDVRSALDKTIEAFVWLCSDAASFVTGHALAVDGGFVVCPNDANPVPGLHARISKTS